jgi:asparagine synthase (glutamine-hydrolysing)
MCGIAGYFGFQNPKLLDDMLHSIKHRGPDEEGTFSDNSAALGIRRLSIVDIEHGQQPISNEDKTVWIVFNGEIYNFLDIRNELINLGHQFYTNTDTETIVHAYEEWNTECLNKLNGMFALAIWDENRRTLFLARDRLGICPLYYWGSPHRFLLASEIKALLTDSTVPRNADEQILYEFLLTGFQSHAGETFFNGIKELPAAHYLLVNKEQIVLRRYWNLSASEPTTPESDSEYALKFRDLLLDAVKIRLPSDLTIGYYLSGGLDSTSIVFLANTVLRSNPQFRSVNSNPQELISAIYHEESADERPFIEEVCHGIKAKTNYVFPSDSVQLADLKSFVYHMDEPVTVLNYYAYWCLARITKGRSKVILSGQGPDEFLAGHPDHFVVYLKELWKKKRITTLLIELLEGLNRYGLVPVTKQAIAMLTPNSKHIENLLNPQFVAKHKSTQRADKPNSLNASLLLDITKNRLPMHLRAGDRVNSAFSIESRYPYLDHRIIEFSFSLPENQKIRKAWTKYVLRTATKNLIPESIRKRKKRGTPIPFERWMKDLQNEIRDVFKSKEFRERGYFNQNAVLDLYDRYCKSKLTRQQRNLYGDIIWRILNVELWFRAFL